VNLERIDVRGAFDWSVKRDEQLQEGNPYSILQQYESADGEMPSDVLPS
jgi:hypothetical protein